VQLPELCKVRILQPTYEEILVSFSFSTLPSQCSRLGLQSCDLPRVPATVLGPPASCPIQGKDRFYGWAEREPNSSNGDLAMNSAPPTPLSLIEDPLGCTMTHPPFPSPPPSYPPSDPEQTCSIKTSTHHLHLSNASTPPLRPPPFPPSLFHHRNTHHFLFNSPPFAYIFCPPRKRYPCARIGSLFSSCSCPPGCQPAGRWSSR